MTGNTEKFSDHQWSAEKDTFVTGRINNDTHLLLDMGMQCVDLLLFLEKDYCMEGQDHL